MKLTLVRTIFSPERTIGTLYVDGVFECFTLEDTVRPGTKVYGRTAIPFGIYKVIITMSERFARLLPLLLDVVGFGGIRIHGGNTEHDTLGCILVGRAVSADQKQLSPGSSRPAFNALYSKIKAALDRGDEVTIEIVDGRAERRAA